MKKTLLACSVMLFPLVLGGCSDKTKSESTSATSPTSSSSESERVEESGTGRLNTATATKAKDRLAERLTARLVEVAASQGPAAAIRVCSEEANVIAEDVGTEVGVRIGRTSHRLRNSKNAPPAWAVDLIKEGAEAVSHVIQLEDGSTAALFPIKLQPQCVMCHGSSEEIKAEVRTELAQLYPNDQATGFAVGDLRGWFWVEVPAAR